MLLQITLKIMSKTWLMNNWGFLYGLSYFLPLLYGPLIFLFASQVLSAHKLRSQVWLHFLPFSMGFLYLVLERQFDFFHPVINGLFRRESGMLLQLASITIYHGLAMQDWTRYKPVAAELDQATADKFLCCVRHNRGRTLSYLCASSEEFALSLLVCGNNRFYLLGKLYRFGKAFSIFHH